MEFLMVSDYADVQAPLGFIVDGLFIKERIQEGIVKVFAIFLEGKYYSEKEEIDHFIDSLDETKDFVVCRVNNCVNYRYISDQRMEICLGKKKEYAES